MMELRPEPMPRRAMRSPGMAWLFSRPSERAVGSATAPVLPRNSTVG